MRFRWTASVDLEALSWDGLRRTFPRINKAWPEALRLKGTLQTRGLALKGSLTELRVAGAVDLTDSELTYGGVLNKPRGDHAAASGRHARDAPGHRRQALRGDLGRPWPSRAGGTWTWAAPRPLDLSLETAGAEVERLAPLGAVAVGPCAVGPRRRKGRGHGRTGRRRRSAHPRRRDAGERVRAGAGTGGAPGGGFGRRRVLQPGRDVPAVVVPHRPHPGSPARSPWRAWRRSPCRTGSPPPSLRLADLGLQPDDAGAGRRPRLRASDLARGRVLGRQPHLCQGKASGTGTSRT